VSAPLALVTGAREGIGRAIAERLAGDGFRLALVARQHDALVQMGEALAAQGCEVRAFAADLADAGDLSRLEDELAAWGEPVAVLVNNAGAGGPYQALVDVPAAAWQSLVALNLTAAFRLTQRVLPGMAAAGWGRIINIASVYALASGLGSSVYTTVKHGLVGLTRSVAVEWGDKGITANAVCPGFIATRMLETLRAADPEQHARLASRIPARRLGRPEEVADLVAFLASARAGYINGTVLAVDGGLSSALP
jgi:NAD(P)-dependent dehydrogenase (short-subunit alcohol dehydrogenase family)